tara:strand:- start:126 stop:1343 length:1218 start_codon:yes stop_codon:yes gene_type:complete
MVQANPSQLGGETAASASKYSRYVWWGMVLGGLYFFGPGVSIFQYGAYMVLFFLGMLYYQQDGMLYACNAPSIPKRPSQNPPTLRTPAERGMEYRSLHIKTSDGCRLHGWLMTVPLRSKSSPTIVYFHGNAGNLGLRLPLYEEFYFKLGCNIVAFDYRGYGDSTGKPNEVGLQLDAKAVLKYVHNDLNEYIDSSQIILFGRSLGGSVATWLAGQKYEGESTGKCDLKQQPHGIRGLVIENTFASIGDLAMKLFGLLKFFQFLFPWLLKSKWLAKEDIKAVPVPIMLLSAQLDLLVPPAHMNMLFKNASDNELTRIHRFFKGGHNDTPIKEPIKYAKAFQQYLRDLDLVTTPVPKPSSGSRSEKDAAVAAKRASDALLNASILNATKNVPTTTKRTKKNEELKKID